MKSVHRQFKFVQNIKKYVNESNELKLKKTVLRSCMPDIFVTKESFIICAVFEKLNNT